MKKTFLSIILIVFLLPMLSGCLSKADKEAVLHVSNLIELIGNVDHNSLSGIEKAEEAIMNLEISLQKKVKNAEVLSSARGQYNQIVANEVVEMIKKIGSVSDKSEEQIKIAMEAYVLLTEDQKLLVENFDLLKESESAFNQLKADKVINDIKKLADVTINSELKIDSVFNSYEALTEQQKMLVTNFDDLIEAQKSYDQLKANKVIEYIENLVNINSMRSKNRFYIAFKNYEDLTEQQKMLVTNFDDLIEAKKSYDQRMAENVIGIINSIGKVTLNDFEKIVNAQNEYDKLTNDQKNLVSNYGAIELARNEYSTLVIENVINLIDSIGAPDVKNRQLVIEARNSYEKLDVDQQKAITNYELLESIEQTINDLDIAEINKLIARLNSNHPQQADLDNSNKISEIYRYIPEERKKDIIDFEKFQVVEDLFFKFITAKNHAAYGKYVEAYNLMSTIRVMDSQQLTKQYEKRAFRWWVEGGMTKNVFGRSEKFEFTLVVRGGKPGESIDISITCQTPNWTTTSIEKDLYDGHGWYENNTFYFYSTRPEYSSQGPGKITIKNYSTGEVLATYNFEIFGN